MSIPLYELGDSLFEGGFGGVAEEGFGFGNVGVGTVYVAGLHGELFDFRGDV